MQRLQCCVFRGLVILVMGLHYKMMKSKKHINYIWRTTAHGNACFLNWNCFAHLHTPKYSCHSKLTLPGAFYLYTSVVVF